MKWESVGFFKVEVEDEVKLSFAAQKKFLAGSE